MEKIKFYKCNLNAKSRTMIIEASSPGEAAELYRDYLLPCSVETRPATNREIARFKAKVEKLSKLIFKKYGEPLRFTVKRFGRTVRSNK